MTTVTAPYIFDVASTHGPPTGLSYYRKCEGTGDIPEPPSIVAEALIAHDPSLEPLFQNSHDVSFKPEVLEFQNVWFDMEGFVRSSGDTPTWYSTINHSRTTQPPDIAIDKEDSYPKFGPNDTVIPLTGEWSNGWYHVVLEYLLGMACFLENDPVLQDIKHTYLLINSKNVPWTQEWLTIVGLGFLPIVAAKEDTSIIRIPHRILIPRYAACGNPHPIQLQWLRNHINRRCPPPKAGPKSIVLIQRNSTRTVQNFTQLYQQCTDVSANSPSSHPVVIFSDDAATALVKLPVIEQIRIFQNAKCVIGSHGAAFLFSIVFQPSTVAIEVFPDDLKTRGCFTTAAKWLPGVTWHTFLEERPEVLPISEIIAVVKEIILPRGPLSSSSSPSLNILACARDVERTIEGALNRIVEFGRQWFPGGIHIFIFENDSKDATRDRIKTWSSAPLTLFPEVALLEGEDLPLGLDVYPRTVRLAIARNRLLEVSRVVNPTASHVLVADLDYEFSERFVSSFKGCVDTQEEWDAVFLNSSVQYYDIWALRDFETRPRGDTVPPMTSDCWSAGLSRSPELSETQSRQLLIGSRQQHLPESTPPIRVRSAFGGAAVYTAACYYAPGTRYYGTTATAANRRGPFPWICEHVAFHESIAAVSHFRAFIYPSWIGDTPDRPMSPEHCVFPVSQAKRLLSPTPRRPIIIFMEYFEPSNHPTRKQELERCLIENARAPYIDHIRLYCNRDENVSPDLLRHPAYAADFNVIPGSSSKLEVVWTDYRPTYQMVLQDANTTYPGAVCIIINSDIVMTPSVEHLATKMSPHDTVACITRWDVQPPPAPEQRAAPMFTWPATLFDVPCRSGICTTALNSQDTWAFIAPLRHSASAEAGFRFGKPGCDNRIAYCFVEQWGLKVTNPCREIITLHYHTTGIRTYTNAERIPGPYTIVSISPSCAVPSETKTIPHF